METILVCVLCLPLPSLHLSKSLMLFQLISDMLLMIIMLFQLISFYSDTYVNVYERSWFLASAMYMYHCKNKMVVLTIDWLLEMCNVGVLLNEHTICYSHNKHILLGISFLP